MDISGQGLWLTTVGAVVLHTGQSAQSHYSVSIHLWGACNISGIILEIFNHWTLVFLYVRTYVLFCYILNQFWKWNFYLPRFLFHKEFVRVHSIITQGLFHWHPYVGLGTHIRSHLSSRLILESTPGHTFTILSLNNKIIHCKMQNFNTL